MIKKWFEKIVSDIVENNIADMKNVIGQIEENIMNLHHHQDLNQKVIDKIDDKIESAVENVDIDYYELSKNVTMSDLAKEIEIDYSDLSDNVNMDEVADNIDYKKLALALIEVAKSKA